jgi:RNA-directed DNA polymerase
VGDNGQVIHGPSEARTLTMTTKLDRFTQKARELCAERFTSLMGLLFDPEGLRESFERQEGRKAPFVPGVTRWTMPRAWRSG